VNKEKKVLIGFNNDIENARTRHSGFVKHFLLEKTFLCKPEFRFETRLEYIKEVIGAESIRDITSTDLNEYRKQVEAEIMSALEERSVRQLIDLIEEKELTLSFFLTEPLRYLGTKVEKIELGKLDNAYLFINEIGFVFEKDLKKHFLQIP